MVGMHYEELKQKQQEIEVKALTALLKQNVIMHLRIQAAQRLARIAMPDLVADELEQETLE